MMQVREDDGELPEAEQEIPQQEAKEIVDDLIVWISQGMRLKRTVLEMLQGSGSASSSGPREQPHDEVEELQRLRWWLNVLLEGDYMLAPAIARVESTGEEGEGSTLQSYALPPGAEDEDGTDDVSWVQKPPPWKTAPGRSRSRSGTRATRGRGDRRDQRGRERTDASAAGGRHTGDDGNEHRPWRRERRLPVAGAGRGCVAGGAEGDRGTSSRAPMPPRTPPPHRPPSALPEDLRQYACHCLLQMADPFSSPARYSYGITEASRQNIQATFDEMEEAERGLGWISCAATGKKALPVGFPAFETREHPKAA